MGTHDSEAPDKRDTGVYGAGIVKAHDGEQAIEAAERLRPDAILLDIGLPGMNGYEVCRRMRQRPWGKDVFLVALTGWGQDEDRQRSEMPASTSTWSSPPITMS